MLACLKTYSAVPFSSVQGGIDALENADVIYTHSGHPLSQVSPLLLSEQLQSRVSLSTVGRKSQATVVVVPLGST